MCRLLGIVSRSPRAFRRCLQDAPRSLGVLGREHGDGWGIAVHDQRSGWQIVREAESAAANPTFEAEAARASGSLLLAHVRKRTIGRVALENTHPFRRGEWVFAHNGTIERLEELRARLGTEVSLLGETDSEVLFAFLVAKLRQRQSWLATDKVLARAVQDLAMTPSIGSSTFLLSNGAVLYAYRQGRPLFLLERGSPDRIDDVLIASEPVTADESWTPITDRTLIAIWKRPELGWVVVR
jgi:glutamine amidotransferase